MHLIDMLPMPVGVYCVAQWQSDMVHKLHVVFLLYGGNSALFGQASRSCAEGDTC